MPNVPRYNDYFNDFLENFNVPPIGSVHAVSEYIPEQDEIESLKQRIQELQEQRTTKRKTIGFTTESIHSE